MSKVVLFSFLLGSLVAVSSLSLVLPVSAQNVANGQQRATSVLIRALDFEYEQTSVEAVGTAEALKSVILFPAAADKIISINFTPGQVVEQGDLLLKLDDRRQRVALARAQIQLADANRNYQRLLNSSNNGAVAQSALDDANTVLALAEVDLAQAKADLEDRRLTAPFTGVLGLTNVEVGDRISQSTAVTTIDQRSQVFINFSAPESALPVLLNSPEVTLQPWSNRDVTLTAKIAEVDSRINENDRTIRTRAILDNAQDIFRPGMSFRVKLTIRGERYAAIPEAALSWGAAGAYIWKAQDGKAQRVNVSVKQRLMGRILVEGDLIEGDDLIVEGIQRLRVGQAVRAVSSAIAGQQAEQGESRG